ncbi:MAG: anhydro-N-acetylmuramic acid kinase [Chloroherpetonaceae bacterium]|nr:anhydro-N-acetylmuramic acid kinase [Chthonomonadaceae bacterium]MDW8207269.1 anhydro-N-acetylmuramic acid kinase [Chloroherpetonaceae bacterium]
MKIIGLMSGTSVDGIDAALLEIHGAPPELHWRLLAFVCVPWEPVLRHAILDVCRPDAPVQQVTVLHFLVGEFLADAARQAADAGGVALSEIDAIASHGQTVWHQPEALQIGPYRARGTLQIGEPAVIAARTGCRVVADFRVADMALGGEGAPLVPFVDHMLFASTQETRVVLNLGGIANVTWLPAGGDLNTVLAFDTGPANMLIDRVTQVVTGGQEPFDRDGVLGARGTPDRDLIADLLAHPFFEKPPPKSTGREMFGVAFADRFLSLAKIRRLSGEDTIATATALTAESVALAFRRWLLPQGPVETVILGGGGTHNRTLVRMLADQLTPSRLTTHGALGVPDDAKEALAFAIMGHETLCGRACNVPAATGATGPAVLGKIIYPPPGNAVS